MAKFRLTDILPHIDGATLRELAEHLLESGHSKEEAVADIVAAIDALVPWAILIPGPVGAVVEALDGPIANAIARLIVSAAASTKRKKKG